MVVMEEIFCLEKIPMKGTVQTSSRGRAVARKNSAEVTQGCVPFLPKVDLEQFLENC